MDCRFDTTKVASIKPQKGLHVSIGPKHLHRYGARVISVDGSSNAVFAKNLKEVAVVLDALISAVKAGELDAVIVAVADRKTRTQAQRNE
jgi:hypothetical protein